MTPQTGKITVKQEEKLKLHFSIMEMKQPTKKKVTNNFMKKDRSEDALRLHSLNTNVIKRYHDRPHQLRAHLPHMPNSKPTIKHLHSGLIEAYSSKRPSLKTIEGAEALKKEVENFKEQDIYTLKLTGMKIT